MLGGSFCSLGLQFFIGAEATIGLAFAQEPVGVLGVNLQPLGLAVGRVRAFTLTGRTGTLIPAQAQPLEILNELRLVTGLAAVEVGIFNSEQELSAGVAGEQPVVERGAGVAYVQQSRRRGRESNARFLCVHTSLILPSENRPARAAVLAGHAEDESSSSIDRMSLIHHTVSIYQSACSR